MAASPVSGASVFGSGILLRISNRTPTGMLSRRNAARVLAVGFPTRKGEYEFLKTCTVPKIFVQSTIDEYGPRPELESLYQGFRRTEANPLARRRGPFFPGRSGRPGRENLSAQRVTNLALHPAHRPQSNEFRHLGEQAGDVFGFDHDVGSRALGSWLAPWYAVTVAVAGLYSLCRA